MYYEQFGGEFKPRKEILPLRLFSLAGGEASVLILALSHSILRVFGLNLKRQSSQFDKA